jgi:hypothetical protein
MSTAAPTPAGAQQQQEEGSPPPPPPSPPQTTEKPRAQVTWTATRRSRLRPPPRHGHGRRRRRRFELRCWRSHARPVEAGEAADAPVAAAGAAVFHRCAPQRGCRADATAAARGGREAAARPQAPAPFGSRATQRSLPAGAGADAAAPCGLDRCRGLAGTWCASRAVAGSLLLASRGPDAPRLAAEAPSDRAAGAAAAAAAAR